MKRLLILIGMITIFAAGNALAQSSKFAAVWSENPVAVQSTACASTEDVCGDLSFFDENAGYTMANIRVPQSKELLVGLSAQVGLFTSTEVKGKRGSYSRALAAAGGSVVLFACNLDTNDCAMGKPGSVILDARIQEMDAILAGVIDECTFDVSLDVDPGDLEDPYDDVATGDATWDLSDCEVAQESISLALSTLSANHFNFVFPDLDQGDYAVVAYFITAAYAEAMAACGDPELYPHCLPGDGDATAISHAFIGKTMLTAQEVRAVKGELNPMEIVEIQ